MVLPIIIDYISIGSILLYKIIPILQYVIGEYSIIVIRCAVVLLIVGIIKHWINVQRMINVTETGLQSVFKKNKTK